MSDIKFSKDEVKILTNKIQLYLREELDKEIGPYYYNRGLYDAQTILESKMENITEAIYEIVKITEFRK